MVAGEDTAAAATSTPRDIFNRMAPVSPAYAKLPILDGFNWSECLANVDAGQWFLVTFRSVRIATADEAVLQEYDDLAFAEALSTSGLLYYFKGDLDEHRHCLSFCIWETADQARLASRLPQHQAAAHLVKDMYESYVVERQLLVKRPGVSMPELQPV